MTDEFRGAIGGADKPRRVRALSARVSAFGERYLESAIGRPFLEAGFESDTVLTAGVEVESWQRRFEVSNWYLQRVMGEEEVGELLREINVEISMFTGKIIYNMRCIISEVMQISDKSFLISLCKT